jgi:hypothetical protein
MLTLGIACPLYFGKSTWLASLVQALVGIFKKLFGTHNFVFLIQSAYD